MKIPSSNEVLDAWVELNERLDRVETDNARLRDALMFYALQGGLKDEDAEPYQDEEGMWRNRWGVRARAALEGKDLSKPVFCKQPEMGRK